MLAKLSLPSSDGNRLRDPYSQRMKRFALVLVYAAVIELSGQPCFGGAAREGGRDVIFGVQMSLPSPNGTFTATTEGGNIFVTNNKTGMVCDSIEVEPPVSYLMWTSDSQTLVSMEHLAMISLVAISHLSGGKWVRHEVELPSELKLDKYSVFELRCKGEKIHVGFGGEHSSNGNARFYRVTFDIDPASNTYSQLDQRAISLAEYSKLPRFGAH